ncbi:DNA polymerase III, delta subunit [alpha proteobacterium HIMB5]|nr:DNA polymerase III, delta subunit [alpha proteobacterium HIMB5]
MIIKNFDLEKNYKNYNFFLFHGVNEGLKEEYLDKVFIKKFSQNSYQYTEKEIHQNFEKFYNEIFSLSFFEKEKLIIVKNVTEKIREDIIELSQKKIEDVKIVLFSDMLDKRSKLRNLFEKEKKLASIPFYQDNVQTLSALVTNFFRNKKISVSSETINLIVNKSNGERKNLKNELEKIEMYTKNKSNISADEIKILTNTAENHDIGELVDNCLAKNDKQIRYLMNENNFGSDDSIIIIRIFLFKAKRLLNLIDIFTEQKNIDKTIASARPPIFWKDKDLIKRQIKSWTLNQVEKLIIEINEIELLVKTNTHNSVHILSDFILNKSK